MLSYTNYELKEIKSLKDLKRSQQEIKEDLFSTIPERTNCITYELDEETKKKK